MKLFLEKFGARFINSLRKILKVLGSFSEVLILLCSLFVIFFIFYHIGFDTTLDISEVMNAGSRQIVPFFLFALSIRFVGKYKDVLKERFFIFDIILLAILTLLYLFIHSNGESFLSRIFINPIWQAIFLFFLSFIHLSRQFFSFIRISLKPTLQFTISFLFIILVGAGLLMMPNAQNTPIRFIDALFVSTSSVCVTGLSTVDIPTVFSITGQIVILGLIQIGGIGIITFMSFFALSFMGAANFQQRLILKDTLGESKWSGLFSDLSKIIFTTFFLEAIGAYFIFLQIEGTTGMSHSQEIYHSVFHAISAYCNAGISTFEGGLYAPLVRFNYGLHFIIALLVILGGIGFPIIFNYGSLVHHRIKKYLLRTNIRKQDNLEVIRKRIISIHTRIVLRTTLILLTVGFIAFYIFEANGVLADLSPTGKWVTAFFGSVTPRTAGFNTFDLTALQSSSLLLIIFLMIVGASPLSTGGGIKTTTLAIIFRSSHSLLRGKTSLNISKREISLNNIQRAFAVLFLYLTWAILATMALSISEKNLDLLSLFFEVISALSTVGLSLGCTADLSLFGKHVIILSMFVGRIGVLTFFSGLIKNVSYKKPRYPSENVFVG